VRNLECARESELLAALAAARWPHACDPALRAHVDGCLSCTELVRLSTALLDDHRALVQEAAVPSSAIVWWRAQMRSRREAVERAAQPITVIQGLAAACAAGLLLAAAGYFSPAFRAALQWVFDVAASLRGTTPPVTGLVPLGMGIVAALCVALIVAPLALYFALREE
jgi:hypothetical protein